MEYITDSGKTYSFSYRELKEWYTRFCEMTDDEFKNHLPEALHFACFVCFLKEIPTRECLADEGIIHELVHLIHIPTEPMVSIKFIRELFKNQLKLA